MDMNKVWRFRGPETSPDWDSKNLHNGALQRRRRSHIFCPTNPRRL